MSRRTSLLLALLPLAACASVPAEEPPPLHVEARLFAGTVLTGPVAGEPELDHAPWAVDVTFAHVDELPRGGEPLGTRVRQVVVERGGVPLQTASKLARGVRLAEATAELPAEAWSKSDVGALWGGMTVHWLAAPNPSVDDVGESRWETFGVRVSRAASTSEAPDALRVGLLFEGWVDETAEEDEDGERAARPSGEPRRVYQTEHLLLDTLPSMAGETLRILLPAPRPHFPRAGEVVDLTIEAAPHPDRPDLVAAIERGRAQFARTGSRAVDDASFEAFRVEGERALEALASRDLRRQALLFLANATEAEATVELALTAEDAWLDRFVEGLRTRLEEAGGDVLDTPAALGWLLERTTYDWLARTAADPERLLPDELGSLLTRRLGELGRHPDLVLEAVSSSSGAEDLLRRVHQENRIFLEDSHPAARVRAFDWLSVRGVAPAGYDPLASPAARREALAQAEEEDA